MQQFENRDVAVSPNSTATTTFNFKLPEGYKFVGITRAWASNPNAFIYNAYSNSQNQVIAAVRNISDTLITEMACYVSILFERI